MEHRRRLRLVVVLVFESFLGEFYGFYYGPFFIIMGLDGKDPGYKSPHALNINIFIALFVIT